MTLSTPHSPPLQQNLLITTKNRWNLKWLIGCHLLVIALITSLLLPSTQTIWKMIDIAFFKLINGSLEGNPNWQVFWALANHKLADWVEDLCILIFFYIYIKQATKGMRTQRVAELIFCALYIGAIIYFINGILFREHLNIPRLSPTLVVDSSFRLSDHITWLKIKDGSSKSFPGDHATTALLFAAIFSYLSKWRLGIVASLYAAFLCMPRLITGAHWLSDVIVGSGSIALICLSLVFCTPVFDACVKIITRCFLLFDFRKK